MRKYRRLRLREIELVKILYSTYGYSMQSIASYFGSSKANVSNILHKLNTADNALFRSHKLIVNLMSKGLDVRQYADLIRVTNMLTRSGVLPLQILIQVQQIVETCYELDIDMRTFGAYFNRFRKFVATIPSNSPEDTQKALITGLETWELA
jgi:hypothetical protein